MPKARQMDLNAQYKSLLVSIDFSGISGVFLKPFTYALFPAMLFSSFYHLGTSCFMVWFLPKPHYNRIPR